MANMMDYLDWRGDLTLGQAPFNEVDNLILSEISYLDLSNIVPGPEAGESVTLARAAEGFFDRYAAGEKIDMGVVLSDEIPVLLKKLAGTARFSGMKLSGYVDHVNAGEGEQFSALTVETGDRQIYCAYRGTDDTLAGWREDLELACVTAVPAQKMAAAYLKQSAKAHPRRGIRLGGHSKGGNLAVYAAVFCPRTVQHRISSVWSNDGPGFLQSMLELPEYQRVRDRIHTIVPRSSVVGMLLEHEERYVVVDSDQLGVWQHDGFSWQVLGDCFITLPQISQQASQSSQAVRRWVHSMTVEERSRFVDALFRVLTASGAETLSDLKEDNIRAVLPMVRAMKELDKGTREGVLEFIQLMVANNTRLVLEDIREGAEQWRSGNRKNR